MRMPGSIGEHGQHAGGRREQQVLQILAEDLDGLFVGAVLQLQPDFGLDGRVEQALVGVLDGLLRGAASSRRGSRITCERSQASGCSLFELDLEAEDAFLGAAADGQHAVRRDLRGRLAVLARTS